MLNQTRKQPTNIHPNPESMRYYIMFEYISAWSFVHAWRQCVSIYRHCYIYLNILNVHRPIKWAKYCWMLWMAWLCSMQIRVSMPFFLRFLVLFGLRFPKSETQFESRWMNGLLLAKCLKFIIWMVKYIYRDGNDFGRCRVA